MMPSPPTDAPIFYVEIARQGTEVIVFSPSQRLTTAYRFARQDVEVLDSGTVENGVTMFNVRIRPDARCTKTIVTVLQDLIEDLRAAGAMEDEPVPVTSTRVTKAKELLAAAATYAGGCSEFVCAVLGIAVVDANTLMGDSPTYIGDKNNYPGLVPGDIVGWKVAGGNGHVSVYVGEAGTKFIDVLEPGARPRKVVNGYGNERALFKSGAH